MSDQLFKINGKKTLITGATGAFGFDIAKEFINHGQSITGLGRNDQGIEKIKNIGVNAVKIDINEENAIKEFSKNCDVFDNIILSHGIPGSRPMRMLSHEFSLNIIQTNLISTLNLLSNLLRARKINSPGRIVFFSSIAARMGANNNIAYAASKLGGEAAMNGLARDLLKKEITVNSIAPAGIETPIYAGTKPAVLDASNYPLGIGLIEDTTNAAMFLCLNGSKYITGETIIMDGGSLWID